MGKKIGNNILKITDIMLRIIVCLLLIRSEGILIDKLENIQYSNLFIPYGIVALVILNISVIICEIITYKKGQEMKYIALNVLKPLIINSCVAILFIVVGSIIVGKRYIHENVCYVLVVFFAINIYIIKKLIIKNFKQ